MDEGPKKTIRKRLFSFFFLKTEFFAVINAVLKETNWNHKRRSKACETAETPRFRPSKKPLPLDDEFRGK